MRSVILLLVLLVLLVMTGTAAGSTTPAAKVRLSTRAPGARPVELTVVISTTLRCGQPFGSTALVLPSGLNVPTRIARDAVRENGLTPGRVTVAGHVVTVSPPSAGITCQSLAVGTQTLIFAAAARLGNPASPGTYAVTVKRGSRTYRGTFKITR